MISKNKIVIGSHFGGLGDHLFLTPIPRLIKIKFPSAKVFLSARSKFRSWEIYKFVWENNPYLDGVICENIDNNIFKKSKVKEGCKVMDNILNNLEIDFIPGEIKPEVYFIEKYLKNQTSVKFKNRVLIDMNYISYVGAFDRNCINRIIKLNLKENPVILNPRPWIKRKWPNLEFLYTKSLCDYIMSIYSSKNLICLTSGSATLGLTLNKKVKAYYGYGQDQMFHHSQNQNIQINKKNFYTIYQSYFLKVKNKIKNFS